MRCVPLVNNIIGARLLDDRRPTKRKLDCQHPELTFAAELVATLTVEGALDRVFHVT